MPRVLNLRTTPQSQGRPGCKYIGRGSKWGNPFILGIHGNRAEVIAKYEASLRKDAALMDALEELTGLDLICFCAPLACHGDVLLRLANPERLVLCCPECGTQHIDTPNISIGWTNPPHRTHKCHSCGISWRPSEWSTTGVAVA